MPLVALIGLVVFLAVVGVALIGASLGLLIIVGLLGGNLEPAQQYLNWILSFI